MFIRCQLFQPISNDLSHMQRLTRTGRLSVIAVASILAFACLAGIDARSYSIQNTWTLQPTPRGKVMERIFTLNRGRISYEEVSWITATQPSDLRDLGYMSGDPKSPSAGHRSILGLSETKEVVLILKDCTLVLLVVDVPLWPLLLLLLIAPIRWLIARPANAPAFPVIAEARQK